MSWLPEGKRGAVCLSVDDVHPAPVAVQALDHLRALQEQHPQLKVTLFTTPDWRTVDPLPTRWTRHVPVLRDRTFVAPVAPRGTYRLDRHPRFVEYLRGWEGAEIAVHGLHHVARGMRPVQEFDGLSTARCGALLDRGASIFAAAGLRTVPGLSPPGWSAPPQLLDAMRARRFSFIASARDLATPPAGDAVAAGSGIRGVPLLHPVAMGSLVHIPTNFQATSTVERALAIIEAGGLLSIKAHLLETCGTYRALDGLTAKYREHLHAVLSALEERFGGDLWWPSMSTLAEVARC